MLPFIPLLGLGTFLASIGVLWWYENLSTADKQRYDSLTASHALSMFQKTVGDLTRLEAHEVHNRVKPYFVN